MHELYCAGHLIEAAVAHFEATKKRKLLDMAIRLADHIDATFGPGKKIGVPGHQEIELALVKLLSRDKRRAVSETRQILSRRARPRDRRAEAERRI